MLMELFSAVPAGSGASAARSKSLRAQLTLLVSAIVIVPAVLSGLLLGLGARHIARQEVFRFVDGTADFASRAVSIELAHYLTTLGRYRTRDMIREYLQELAGSPSPARQRWLRLRLKNQFARLAEPRRSMDRPTLALAPNGRLLAWAGLPDEQAPVVAARYTPAMLSRAGRPMITDPYLDPIRQVAAVDVMAAVQSAAPPHEVVAVLIWTQYLPEALGPLLAPSDRLPRTAEWVLVNREGYPILDLPSQPGTALRERMMGEAAARARMGQEGTFVGRDYRGQLVVASPRLIPGVKWGLVSKVDLREAYAGIYDLTLIWFGLTVLMIGGGYLLARATAQHILAPIDAISMAARRMAAGDDKARVSLQRDDELGELARDFNIMAEEVYITREELGRLVAERTAELQTAVKNLQRLNEELSTFTYTASHDLAAPLISLQGLSRILLRDHAEQLDEEGVRKLQRLQANVEMLESLVNDLLELSRVGRIETNPVDLDPLTAVADVLSSLHETIASSGVEIAVPEPETCPLVHMEPNRLRQILSNLLSNALKYGATAASPRVEIACQKENDDFVRVTVADNGPGIPPEQRERAFLPFQRLRSAPDVSGTGMGLVIVRKIVEHYGGTIWIDASPGGGAAFSFTVPAARQRDDETAPR